MGLLEKPYGGKTERFIGLCSFDWSDSRSGLSFWLIGMGLKKAAEPFARLPVTLSVFRGDSVSSTVVVLRNPQLVGNDLSYEVRVLEGTLPAQSGPCSLFIDIIGMPLTPLSYAGAARRAWRRGMIAPAYYAPAPYYPPLPVTTAQRLYTTAIQSCARASSGKRRPPVNVQLRLDPAPAFAGVESVDHAYLSSVALLSGLLSRCARQAQEPIKNTWPLGSECIATKAGFYRHQASTHVCH